MQQVLDDLNWRYATKRFDADQKLSVEQLAALKESIRLTATSYGLQAYKVLQVDTPEIREKLMEASFGQRPVVEASHLFVFCAYRNVEEADVYKYVNLIAKTRGTDPKDLEPFSIGIIGSLEKKSQEEIENWTTRQTYIALGQLLHTCASLRIDALPMEGFNPKQYNEILGLDKLNLTATLACPVGFRHAEDIAQFKKKVRKPNEELFDLR
ncbi:MAG: NAD(P)H-dependent oxidoreductase [Crocinitomicaceae bacterium]